MGSNLDPLHWDGGVSVTGPPRKSLASHSKPKKTKSERLGNLPTMTKTEKHKPRAKLRLTDC